MESLTLFDKLVIIQRELKAPKNRKTDDNRYHYRNCDDILNALKPLLSEHGCFVLLADEVVQVGDRFYIRAIAKLTDGKTEISVTAYAREVESAGGMSPAQVTGSASSYARKYALNGLLAIDDSVDDDSTSTGKQKIQVDKALADKIAAATNVVDLKAICTAGKVGKSKEYIKAILDLYTAKKEELGGEI